MTSTEAAKEFYDIDPRIKALSLNQQSNVLSTYCYRGAAIALWICLRLPSCCPGFKSQAHHLRFQQFITLCNLEKTKINKRGRDWPI